MEKENCKRENGNKIIKWKEGKKFQNEERRGSFFFFFFLLFTFQNDKNLFLQK